MKEAIKINNIHKDYKGVKALQGVSFNIKQNIIFGLLGSNGAGKSTLLHIITGLLDPSEGDFSIFGEKIENYTKELKKEVAIVPQEISLYDELNIYENLYFFGNAYGLKKQEIIERINELSEVLKLGDLKRKVKNLSGGYKRRTSLAIGLIGHPKILILDEAMVGIDLETKKIISDLLKRIKEYITIIITTHSVREAEELCDCICFLHKGKKIVYGKTEEIIEEFSKTHGEKIIVEFKNPEFAREFFKDHLNKNIELKEDKIYIKFSSSKNNSKDIINFVNKNAKYDKLIESIEINNPGLEDVMLELMDSE